MAKSKLFAANITLRHGEYETLVKRLIIAKSQIVASGLVSFL